MNGIKYAMLAGIATLLCTGITSCDNDDEDVVPAEEVTTPKTVSVAFGTSASLGLGQIAEGIYSENPFIAEVDAQGIVTGKHVGSTVVHNGNQTVNVTVTGTVNLFPEPVTAWGATMDEVKKQHALGGWTKDYYYVPDGNDSYRILIYTACNEPISQVIYSMTSASKNLGECSLFIPAKNDIQNIIAHLSEHYEYVGSISSSIHLFVNGYTPQTTTTAVYLQQDKFFQTDSQIGMLGGTYHRVAYIQYIPEEEETTPSQTQANMLKHAAQRARTLNILPE